jgi:hypothetical protein
MKLIAISTVALAAPAMGFVMPSTCSGSTTNKALHMSSAGLSEEESYVNPLPTQKGKKMSEAIPFLKCPEVLKDSDLAGNVGFDPLGFATSRDQLWNYREAEVKHARLAMLVRKETS